MVKCFNVLKRIVMRGGLYLRKFFRGASFYILIFIILLILVQQFAKQPQQTVDIDFSVLYKELADGNVEEIHIVDRTIEGSITRNNETVHFKSFIPTVFSEEKFTEIIEEKITDQNNLKVTGAPPPSTPWFIE